MDRVSYALTPAATDNLQSECYSPVQGGDVDTRTTAGV